MQAQSLLPLSANRLPGSAARLQQQDSNAEQITLGRACLVLEHRLWHGIDHAGLLSAAQRCKKPLTTDTLKGRVSSLQLCLCTCRAHDLLRGSTGGAVLCEA